MKNITQSLKVITLALFLSFGISYVYAWTAPTATPPSGNVAAPINTSATGQYKAGGLGIEGLIRGYGNAIFDGNVTVGGSSVCRQNGMNCPVLSSGIPSGMIAMFDTSCPSGWTRFSSLDNRVPRGSATYGSTGGSETHTHATIQSNTYWGYHFNYHRGHQSTESNLDPYLTVIWCKKN